MTRARPGAGLLAVILPASLVVAFSVALCLGSPVMSPADVGGSLADPDGLTHLRVWEMRAPRTLVGLACGAAFGIAGLLLQRGLGNPLAVPELLGVSSGAACAVAGFVVTGSAIATAWYPLLAVAGAFLGGGTTLLIASGAKGAVRILLVGSAVSSALAAVTVAFASLADRLQLQALLRYLSGSLIDIYWPEAAVVLPWVLAACGTAVCVAPMTRVLALGDDAASAAGLHPRRSRLAVVVIGAVLVAVPTAFVGPIAWVGFAAPHTVRILAPNLRPLPEAAAAGAVGAVVVVGADIAARTVFAPIETPLGAWTAAGALLIALTLWAGRTGLRPRTGIR